MVALSRNLAAKHALEMLLLGEMVPAAEAARMGLVNRVVPAGRGTGGSAAACRRNRLEIAGHRQDRQARLLRAARDGFERRL
jgi:enoyl-CoA hydratase/carnithine racemase